MAESVWMDETVVCEACTRLHFINRQTHKLLGERDMTENGAKKP